MTKIQKVTYYILMALMSIGFLAAGIPKVMADPMQVAGFASAHLPLWFLYFIGAAEILGAIGLWIPKLSRYAIYGLSIILVGAMVITAIFMSPVFALIPLVYLIVLGIIYWLGKKKGQTVESPSITPPTV